jgi:hypothetical protein
VNRAAQYLVTDSNGRCFRVGRIETGCFRRLPDNGNDIVSQNLWECAVSPVLAVMKNPLHAECRGPRLFRIDCRKKTRRETVALKLDISEVALPTVVAEQKLAFAMYAVRQLAPEHRFSHWVERWLSRIDRSRTGARLAMLSLIETAEEVEVSLNELSRLGFQESRTRNYQNTKLDFLWRAWSVAEAAIVYVEKTERWEVALAEKIATSVKGVLNESRLADLADLAMHVEPKAPVGSYVSETWMTLRRDEERLPSTQDADSSAVFELKDTGLLIRQYNDIPPNQK